MSGGLLRVRGIRVVIVCGADAWPRGCAGAQKPAPHKHGDPSHLAPVVQAAAMAFGAAPHRFGAATGLFLGGQTKGSLGRGTRVSAAIR